MADALKPREMVRWVWGSLTSMRTALTLLFLLAVAAVPGSMIPQRPVSPIKVSDFIEANPTLGRVYDAVGLFDVYGSVWFSAVYLLLFISLIGCILPRIGVYFRAVRAKPTKVPKRLDRLPASESVEVSDANVLAGIETGLRRRHYRVVRRGNEVSAEKGYLREAGNLVFHLSLVVVLIGVAIASLGGFKGTANVVVGQGFSNTLTQYDEIQAGATFTEADLAPFSMTIDEFVATFEEGPVQRGAAREFRADVTVVDHPGAAATKQRIEVNHPLSIDGTQVHLSGHGYAPVVEVRDAQGNVAFNGPVVFVPQDGNFTSVGVVKAPDARVQRLAFEGFFLPTGVIDQRGPHSSFPDAQDPVLILNAWHGDPKEETGRPENVYVLDTAGMKQVDNGAGQPLRMMMRPGDQVALPGGLGSVKFVGYQRWVKLQLSQTPGLTVALVGVGLAIAGLCGSLFIVPRRIWARVVDVDGRRLLQIGGLDRAESRLGLAEEVAAVASMGHDGAVSQT